MRISLLEKREDFYKILYTTLSNYAENINVDSSKLNFFVVNRYLNFIADPYLPSSLFVILQNEYSNSQVKWKKIFQLVYVQLSVKRVLRILFAQKVIKLPAYFSKFLILGGNHRIRLFSKQINGSLVILKTKECDKFLSNDIKIRESFQMSFAPAICDKGNDWFIEEYFEGTPINRLARQDDFILDVLMKSYETELLEMSKEVVSISYYKGLIDDEVDRVFLRHSEGCLKDIKKLVSKTIKALFDLIKIARVEISWTHGDLQEANILVKNGELKVIDWESADRRFYLYDYFTLFSKIRTNVSLNKAINTFLTKFPTDTDVIYFLLIEEIRFAVNEEVSFNYSSGCISVRNLCDDILKLTND